jgi:predicted nucleotidyltransferase
MSEFYGRIIYYSYTKQEKSEIISRISEFFKSEENVLLAYIYGSFIHAQTVQDVDLGIVCKEDKILPATYPFTLSNRMEEYIKPYKLEVDIKLLNEMPSWFRFNILKKGLCIYNKDKLRQIHFEKNTVREYLDLKPQMEFYNKNLLRKIQNG